MMTTTTFVIGLLLLWIALGFQINSKFEKLEARLDERDSKDFERFEGLRRYLYELDPQFEEELAFERELWSSDSDPFSGSILHKIQEEKKERGDRTLDTRFS